MFRKEEALAKDWTPEKSRELSQIQRELILQAADMLRPGGLLLYSTCTFAPTEDEGVVSWLLEKRPDMKLLEIPQHSGFSPGVPGWGNGMESLKRCVRLFPHKIDGEGHFMALLKKDGTGDNIVSPLKPAQIRPQKNGSVSFLTRSVSGLWAVNPLISAVWRQKETRFTIFRLTAPTSADLSSSETACTLAT